MRQVLDCNDFTTADLGTEIIFMMNANVDKSVYT